VWPRYISTNVPAQREVWEGLKWHLKEEGVRLSVSVLRTGSDLGMDWALWEGYIYTGVPGGKVNILGGYSIGHSKQKTLYEHVSYSERFPRYSHLNANRKIVDKKEIFRVSTVSNTSIYCSSDRVGIVYNKCSKIPHIHMLQTLAHHGGREGQYWAPKPNHYTVHVVPSNTLGIPAYHINRTLYHML
jgi:hypothetical protein